MRILQDSPRQIPKKADKAPNLLFDIRHLLENEITDILIPAAEYYILNLKNQVIQKHYI